MLFRSGLGEHRDDIAAVVDASPLPRGATASARLALAWSSQRLLLWNAATRWPRQHGTQSPWPGGTSRAEGLCFERRTGLRISGDRRWQAVDTSYEPPLDGLLAVARGIPSRMTSSVPGRHLC